MDSTSASNVFNTIDVMQSCTVNFCKFSVFVVQESVEKRPSTSIMVSSMPPGFLCVVNWRRALLSHTSRSGEIRLALQTELVVKRGIQSVGVDHFEQ